MFSLLHLLTTAGAMALSAPDQPKFSFVDLSPHANHGLDVGIAYDGNNLANLKRNEQTLKGITFKIPDKFLQLGSTIMEDEERKNKPDKAEGIKVNAKFSRLHILHATEYGTGNPSADGKNTAGPLYIADDTPIAEYKLHYADGTTETIPVVYGKDVRDWWYGVKSGNVSRGTVAWTGENDYSKTKKLKIRLYATSWKNPHPEKQVKTIDFLKVGNTVAAPFCVAITMEE